MKSATATPRERVKEIEKNVQEEVWEFIAKTMKQGLKYLLENLLEEITTKASASMKEIARGKDTGEVITGEAWLPGMAPWKTLRCHTWQRHL